MAGRNKYHNSKCLSSDGMKFDSKKELRRWEQLRMLERGKVISDLQRQVRFNFPLPNGDLLRYTPSNRAVTYVADFVYFDNGNQVVEDAKGVRTDVYKLKAALMLALNGIKITEV